MNEARFTSVQRGQIGLKEATCKKKTINEKIKNTRMSKMGTKITFFVHSGCPPGKLKGQLPCHF